MKKYILYITFIFTSISSYAQLPPAIDDQPNEKKEEKIQALYIAYMTQQLKLTPEEAQKFWPVHSQYVAELKSIGKDNADELVRQQAILNIKKKYQANFNKVLGNERCNNFYRQDSEFRKKMMERLKQLRQQRMQERNNGNRRNTKPMP